MLAETPLMPTLREEIRAAGGRITFARFMELCLYHPQFGYYNTVRVKLGKGGDFYTSAHLGPVFARLLARHFDLLWQELGKPGRFDLVELGPGDGWFATELLPWIAQRFPEFSSRLHYTAVEQSPAQRSRLQEKLAASGSRIRILEDLPASAAEENGTVGCVFANEFFDALPVHLLIGRESGWAERYVCLTNDAPAWSEGALSSPEPERIAARYLGNSQEGRVGEACVLADRWMETIGRSLARGELLIVDYGYESQDWQEGRFSEGSALGYHRHQVVNDLLSNPGEQDLTAHVNFTQLKEAGRQCGLDPSLFLSQSRFLTNLAASDEFHDVFAGCATDRERQQRAQQLKTLILPQGMGETFRVLQFRKGM